MLFSQNFAHLWNSYKRLKKKESKARTCHKLKVSPYCKCSCSGNLKYCWPITISELKNIPVAELGSEGALESKAWDISAMLKSVRDVWEICSVASSLLFDVGFKISLLEVAVDVKISFKLIFMPNNSNMTSLLSVRYLS